ncbi:MAG: class I SAM-dependent methyltransferase [bacterium]|nr:class I SAM-dependent methyltransferase [bacterium]
MENSQETWWREWFNEIYLEVYAHRDDPSAVEEVRAALQAAPARPADQILDLCCGNGRHCRGFQALGYPHVLGIDYSFPLLRHAQAAGALTGYVRADMRRIPCRDQQFEAVFSFFTSFGYFPTDQENHAVLAEIARVLKPGGWFLMDYLNPAHVRAHYIPQTKKTQGSYHIQEQRSLTADQTRIEKTITLHNTAGQTHTFHESVRLYEREAMLAMLSSAGLSVSGILGDFQGQEYSLAAPRMILHGTRL